MKTTIHVSREVHVQHDSSWVLFDYNICLFILESTGIVILGDLAKYCKL